MRKIMNRGEDKRPWSHRLSVKRYLPGALYASPLYTAPAAGTDVRAHPSAVACVVTMCDALSYAVRGPLAPPVWAVKSLTSDPLGLLSRFYYSDRIS